MISTLPIWLQGLSIHITEKRGDVLTEAVVIQRNCTSDPEQVRWSCGTMEKRER